MDEKEFSCPLCKIKLASVKLGNAEIKHCTRCGGISIEEDALRNITGIELERSRQITCQRCNNTMQIRYMDDVEVDFCPTCHLIWFDNRELGKAVGIDPREGINEGLVQFIKLQQKLLRSRK